MFDPSKQYRCTIIRGKAKTELDNLLPAYCRIIQAICPTSSEFFRSAFNNSLIKSIPGSSNKTLDNHRTEIAGKLFGLWFESDGYVYTSQMCESILERYDNPAFFKEIVLKIQFPNGMDKIQTVKDRVSNNIKFRPTPFILAVAKEFQYRETVLYKSEIAYYILNCLEVLQGTISVNEVVDKIIENRTQGVIRKISTPNKASSYDMQHITEFLGLMELANVIIIKSEGNDKIIELNNSEITLIENIIEKYLNKLDFDPYSYDLNSEEGIVKFYQQWNFYYTGVLIDKPDLSTSAAALIRNEEIKIDNISVTPPKSSLFNPLAIGDEGECIVMEFEKQRVAKFNKRLVNKVIHLGKQRGLGYDISSILASGSKAEHAIYIEVKTTMRVTEPPDDFTDQFDMTRNEWIAAEQHIDNFYIYRVYLYNNGIKIFKLNSPVKLKKEGKIYAEPLKYHIEFDNNSGVFIHENK